LEKQKEKDVKENDDEKTGKTRLCIHNKSSQ
jgi:hypothetical protein